jgi:hypothetical protein
MRRIQWRGHYGYSDAAIFLYRWGYDHHQWRRGCCGCLCGVRGIAVRKPRLFVIRLYFHSVLVAWDSTQSWGLIRRVDSSGLPLSRTLIHRVTVEMIPEVQLASSGDSL